MVAQNKILVSEIRLFISNLTEQEWKSNEKKKNELGNNVSSRENGSYENTSVVTESQTYQFSSSQKTGIYPDNFTIKIAFKPLYLPLRCALFVLPKFLFMLHATHDWSNSIKQQ